MHNSTAYKVEDLQDFMVKAFVASGVPLADAQTVTDNLLQAELRGISSHGLSRFPVYLRRIQKGLVNPKPNIVIEKTLPSLFAVDGDNGLGSVVMVRALEEGMKSADITGMCAIGIKGSNHFGISTYYCELAAEKGYVSIVLTDGPPATPPWGGKESYFGTNPMAFGMPRRKKPHLIVDLATSVAARGKIIRAADRGEQIPEGWALDKDGYPTTDAKAALGGVLMPIAGPKGYALSLAIEHLAGVFTGAGYGRGVAWQYGNSEDPSNVGHLVVLIKADAFLAKEDYEERTEQFVSEIKNISLAPGFSEIKLPGEREWERSQAVLSEGITLEPELRTKFMTISQELNIELA